MVVVLLLRLGQQWHRQWNDFIQDNSCDESSRRQEWSPRSHLRISDIFKDNTQIDDLAAIKAEGVNSWSRLHTKSFKVKSMLMSLFEMLRSILVLQCACLIKGYKVLPSTWVRRTMQNSKCHYIIPLVCSSSGISRILLQLFVVHIDMEETTEIRGLIQEFQLILIGQRTLDAVLPFGECQVRTAIPRILQVRWRIIIVCFFCILALNCKLIRKYVTGKKVEFNSRDLHFGWNRLGI